jgi:hypothetical protein
MNLKNALLPLSMLLFFLLLRCAEEEPRLADSNTAGLRIIALDLYNQEDTRFYINGRVNGDGDTAVYNTKNEKVSDITSTYVPVLFTALTSGERGGNNIARTAYIDLKPPFTAGVYTYKTGGYAIPELPLLEGTPEIEAFEAPGYFPDASHRFPVRPIINQISYHKWASLPAGPATLSFRASSIKTIRFTPTTVLGPVVYTADINLEKNRNYTLFYTKTAFSSSDAPKEKVIVLKEDPLRYQFNDSSAYIRFLNFTKPARNSEAFNLSTSSIDVYIVKIGPSGAVQPEVLVQQGLKRFEADASNTAFFEIDLRDLLKATAPYAAAKTGEPLIALDTTLQNFTYVLRFYKSGESAALNRLPVSEMPVTMRYNEFVGLYGDQTGLFFIAKDNQGFQPMIMTVLFCISTLSDNVLSTIVEPIYRKMNFAVYNFEPANGSTPYFK